MTPNSIIAIPLNQNQTATVSEVDADLANFKWFVDSRGNKRTQYATRTTRIGMTNRRKLTIKMHKVISERELGRSLLVSEQIDHIDGNGLNNCRDNLRVVSNLQNAANQRKSKNNTSGYKGVSRNKNGRYTAHIRCNWIQHHLGTFATAEEAHEAYKKAAVELFGVFARFE